MKPSILLSCCLLLFSLHLTAQSPWIEQSIDGGRWITCTDDVRFSPSAFMQHLHTTYRLDVGTSFYEMQHRVPHDRGLAPIRYQQYYDGIPVEGAIYHVHERQVGGMRANGQFVSNLDLITTPRLTAQDAVARAFLYIGADKYAWQDPVKEALIKRIQGDPDATFYPSPSLVLADPDYGRTGENYRLAWKMEIYAEYPAITEVVYVDAVDGDILYTLSTCQEAGVPAVGETRYSGVQSFITDSIAPDSFRLYDETRGRGIHTIDMNNETTDDLSLSSEFTDEDNYWALANERYNDAAVDVHWGMQGTYDYFDLEQGWQSYDGDSAMIISYVHVRRDWFNARWTGMWAEFGDGNSNPLTSIDVVSHELTHGVTRNSSGLIYRNESGALNESFSDIFGNAVEAYLNPDSFSWEIGEANFVLRNMSNPNDYGHPDTYLGTNWFTEDGDNGGVHTNSGVQNFWYYLLSAGGQGTNDYGDAYQVDAIGMDAASAIAFRNLTVYLTPSSNHEDARQGAIWAAEDLYGPCSEEVEQTINAWHAVGVGPAMTIRDVTILEVLSPDPIDCAFGDQEVITVRLLHQRSGCSVAIPAGTAIPIDMIGVRWPEDTVFIMRDTLVLSEAWPEGDTMMYTYDGTVDLSASAYYDLELGVRFSEDQHQANDEVAYTLVSIDIIEDSTLLRFDEFVRPAMPALWLDNGDEVVAEISSRARATGLRGILLTGSDNPRPDIDRPTGPDDDIFDLNPTFSSYACMCVDASEHESVEVSFDLRQGYAEGYAVVAPEVEAPYQAIGLRLTVDGEQVSPTYHPDTIRSRDFVRQTVDLSDYAGLSFQLCFEGKNYFNWRSDNPFDGDGDFSHIDNVLLAMEAASSVSEVDRSDAFHVYPNPAQGQVNWFCEGSGRKLIEVMDTQGRRIQFVETHGSEGVLPLTGMASGLYFLRVEYQDRVITRRLMVID